MKLSINSFVLAAQSLPAPSPRWAGHELSLRVYPPVPPNPSPLSIPDIAALDLPIRCMPTEGTWDWIIDWPTKTT